MDTLFTHAAEAVELVGSGSTHAANPDTDIALFLCELGGGDCVHAGIGELISITSFRISSPRRTTLIIAISIGAVSCQPSFFR